ncbi:hypothetical protein NC653_036637 [Populus alba x Populus x berolinensis]|uniref:Uncharacterized protein n=1 Tax=Populus alba x Populus x berolinensis TaxID=444605 RepID=A0AAD6LKP6_9ROSI|nr:hypothetical protein NC653_036637 [Populus alba x Populus x berolinensis]
MRPPLTQVLLSVIRERPSTKRAIYIWWVFVMVFSSDTLILTVLWHLPLDFLVRFLLLSFTPTALHASFRTFRDVWCSCSEL